jgi:hypothetical protein
MIAEMHAVDRQRDEIEASKGRTLRGLPAARARAHTAARSRPILLEHRGEDLQSRTQRQFRQLGLGVDEQIDERQTTHGRFWVGNGARLCETSSWRLLVVRPCGLGLGHHSFYTSSEEPPLSIFNSYWDIPTGRVG